MNFKKRVNGSWVDTPNYIHKTSTDTITTLPAVIYPTGTTATVGLKGNMSQTGTPTPTTPIQPQETGENTENLWNNRGFSASAIGLNYTHNISNNYGTTLSTTKGNEVTITQSAYPTGNEGFQNGFFMIDVDFSKYAVGDVVTISFDYIVNEIHALSTQFQTTVYAGSDSNAVSNFLSSGDWKVSGRLITRITIIADMRPYVEVRLCGNSITVKNIMLNTGLTALPYEPYGYKIPILSNSTTTNVYLGEVESTRRVKKLVLTGDEGFTEVGSGGIFRLSLNGYLRNSDNVPYSTHYNGIAPVSATNQIPNETIAFLVSDSGNNYLYIRDDTYINSVTNFKAYLQQQYSAGTPVCVWYVLATPETGIVNEPIRKIGTYADEVSGITTPTIAGANTISVDTTLQPSEVTVNYKGWHPVQSVHERENGQWD